MFSWFKKTKTKHKIETLDGVDVFNVPNHFQKIINQSSTLKKQATAFKKEKNWKEAIEKLKAAYELDAKYHIGVTTKETVRLPNYYYWSKDYKNAWIEYHKVAELFYHSWYKKTPITMYGIQSEAYTRIANMLFDLKNNVGGIAYGCAEYVAYRNFVFLDEKSIKELGTNSHYESIEDGLRETLDRLMCENTWDERLKIYNIVFNELKKIPNVEPLNTRDLILRYYNISIRDIEESILTEVNTPITTNKYDKRTNDGRYIIEM